MAQEDVKPAWSWLGRPLAVDLANTVIPTATGIRELLTDASALDGWLAAVAPRLEPLESGATTKRLGDFLLLRDAVRTTFGWLVDPGGPPPVPSVDALNGAVAAAPAVLALSTGSEGPVFDRRLDAGLPSTRALAIIAAEAVSLAAGEHSGRLGRCTAPGCGAFFVGSRSRQHWCSPACGNRARVARHAQRARQG